MANQKETLFSIAKGMTIPLGTTAIGGGMNFAISLPNVEECVLHLFQLGSGELVTSILLDKTFRNGSIFAVHLAVKKPQEVNFLNYTYSYSINNKEVKDPYAKDIYGRQNYGTQPIGQETSVIRYGFIARDFDWQQDSRLQIPYSQMIIYKMNVRGFTKHASSKVKKKGTFHGVIEKIPYLKELGINCIQVMPIYEFNEIKESVPGTEYREAGRGYKTNYWGYTTDNQYFAPKASYSSIPLNPQSEFKTLVKTLHQNRIEILMEMYFPYGINQCLIQDCLRYWVEEYHVDGFKLAGEAVPWLLLATDPVLSNVKLLAAGWDYNSIYEKEFVPNYKNLAEYNDTYSVNVKRLIKGDENQVKAFSERFKYNPGKAGVINYITNQDGFTLMDLVSYDIKHNEVNEENNLDGIENNYSWNCGQEGKTKKKKVVELRRKQIRNALVTLFCSQGTPLILAGDEFGNSQDGNNNAYCQDNEISWLNWEDLNTNKDIYNYVKALIQLRKQHPILHMEQPLKNMDYISCGYPELSFHGTKAWYPDYSFYSRMLGILLAGRYAKINRKENDSNFFIAYNLHWENHVFDLPKLPKGMQWHIMIDTREALIQIEDAMLPLKEQKQHEITARSIVVFIGK